MVPRILPVVSSALPDIFELAEEEVGRGYGAPAMVRRGQPRSPRTYLDNFRMTDCRSIVLSLIKDKDLQQRYLNSCLFHDHDRHLVFSTTTTIAPCS